MSSNTISHRFARWRRLPRLTWRLIFAALLVLPPALRWLSPALHTPTEEPARETALEATVLALRVELETARFEAERLRAEAQSRGQVVLADRYERLLADVLPLSDPSPHRRILWAHVPGARNVLRPTAALCGLEAGGLEAGSFGNPGGGAGITGNASALVGRALAPTPHLPIARVETTLDPAFRVRFRHHGASGVLWGTGEESDGKPVLVIKHLSELIELKDGEPVVTEGRDGVYPEGVLIGFVARESAPDSSPVNSPEGAGTAKAPPGRLFVRGAVAPETLNKVVLAVDRVQDSLARLRALEAEASP